MSTYDPNLIEVKSKVYIVVCVCICNGSELAACSVCWSLKTHTPTCTNNCRSCSQSKHVKVADEEHHRNVWCWLHLNRLCIIRDTFTLCV